MNTEQVGENRMVQDNEWLILDAFRNVLGPYAPEEIRRRVQQNPNFFVYLRDHEEWVPAEALPELTGLGPRDAKQGYAQASTREMERAIDELMGVCRGIIADGKVVPHEADYLVTWLEKHQSIVGMWPASVLTERLQRIYADGIVDEWEQEELAELLGRIVGEKPGFKDAIRLASERAVDFPEPRIEFAGKAYSFTGRFAYGPRSKCVEAVESRGGMFHQFPNLDTDYLVVGALQGKKWELANKGKKIEYVVTTPEARSKTAIISEENWTYHL
ncbi:MAG: BRCT domain-containing protein [SAR324 cluster bacterium]|nr:BRCT domain-containing protein [SAR324 cluster bacterium]